MVMQNPVFERCRRLTRLWVCIFVASSTNLLGATLANSETEYSSQDIEVLRQTRQGNRESSEALCVEGSFHFAWDPAKLTRVERIKALRSELERAREGVVTQKHYHAIAGHLREAIRKELRSAPMTPKAFLNSKARENALKIAIELYRFSPFHRYDENLTPPRVAEVLEEAQESPELFPLLTKAASKDDLASLLIKLLPLGKVQVNGETLSEQSFARAFNVQESQSKDYGALLIRVGDRPALRFKNTSELKSFTDALETQEHKLFLALQPNTDRTQCLQVIAMPEKSVGSVSQGPRSENLLPFTSLCRFAETYASSPQTTTSKSRLFVNTQQREESFQCSSDPSKNQKGLLKLERELLSSKTRVLRSPWLWVGVGVAIGVATGVTVWQVLPGQNTRSFSITRNQSE